MAKRKRKHRTAKQKAEIVDAINVLVKDGVPVQDACKQAGVAQNLFYMWRKGATQKPAKARPSTHPAVHNEPMASKPLIALVGTRDDVVAALGAVFNG